MLVLAGKAAIVGWGCFIVGLVVLLAGVVIGLWISFARETNKTIEEAKKQVDELKPLAAWGVTEAGASIQAQQAVQEKLEKHDAALEQTSNIIGSLPEKLRFSGLLVIVGTILVGVATIEFNGVSLF